MNFKAVWSIIKKELKSYFYHPIAYIVLTIFVVLNSFFFFRDAYMAGEASMRPQFEILPWFFLFLVPAVTMKALASERKEGTLEVMLSQPISEVEFLAGKFIADLIFVTVALCLTLLIPITLLFGGKLDFGLLIAQYKGAFFLAAAFVAIGIFCSALTKNQTVAFISSLVISFFLVIAGLEVVTMGVSYPVNDILRSISILAHFENITRGLIDLRDIVYFISLSFIFLSLTYLFFMRKKLSLKSKKYLNLQMGIAMMIAIAIVVNLFGGLISYKFDFTEGKQYSLSDGTRTVLKEIDDDVTIKFFASQELPSQAGVVYRDVKDMLADYASVSGGKVRVEYRYPDSNQDVKDQASRLGVTPVQFNVQKAEEFSVKEGYLGVALQYKDKKEAIPFVQQTSDFEYQLTSLIRKMTNPKKHKIVFLSGHGEKQIGQGGGLSGQQQGGELSLLSQELEKQNEVKTAEAKTLAKDLKGADVLIIAGPKQPFKPAELKQLQAYLDGGGKALVLADMQDVNPQYMMAQENKNNVNELIKKYGIEINKDLVYDLSSNERVTLGGQGGQMGYVLPYPFWLKAPASANHIVTGSLKSMFIAWANSLKVTNKEAEIIIKTTENAGHQTSNFNISPDKNTGISQKGLKEYTLGVALKNPRLIVVGDSDLILSELAQRNPVGISFALNAIDWLASDEVLISIRSKNSGFRQLVFGSDQTKVAVKYLNMVGTPILIIAFGAFILTRRRKRMQQVYSYE
ncbi:MAG: hypothetical protein C4562_07305 [Actinobacteria bacterium]|nr:MAG: hypothetical protein C4562_07305 [Actinomycetota bacterium]